MGYEEYPYRGQGLGLALPGFLLRPLPRFGPCRARLPWRVRLWVVPPLARLPRRVGGPLFFVRFAPFFLFLFCVLVRFTAGRSRVELGRLWVTFFWSSSIRFGFSASGNQIVSIGRLQQQNWQRVSLPTAAQDSS